MIRKSKLSVIIPTYNEAGSIIECLESLGDQTYKDFEIIVVDDGSSDGTYEMVKNAAKLVKTISLLKQDHKGPGAARNLGAKKARGKILVFLDADMTFDKSFLIKLVRPIIEGKAKGTFSKSEYVANWENVWARCWNINEGWVPKLRHKPNYPDSDKVFRAILKSQFKKVGGFTPGGYTDDYSLSEKLGYKAKNAKGAIFYHKNPDNLGEVYHQAKWTAKRKYKLGRLGYFVGMIRATFPISIIIGLYKAVVDANAYFVVFKVVYDFGVFVGIINYLISGQGAK
jgi:glycosyltransferase involved in cell wall biosynthesis